MKEKKKNSNRVIKLIFIHVQIFRQNVYESLLLNLSAYQTTIERYPLLATANSMDIEKYGQMVDQTGNITEYSE